MSREIKFRAWDKKHRKYTKILKVYFGSDGSILGALVEDYETNYAFELQANQVEFEQYTGLKDKNGKEICEGDIVKVYAWTNLTRGMEYRHTTKVFWQERYAQFNTTYNDALSNEITQDYFEVIGNIHENPELIEDDPMGK